MHAPHGRAVADADSGDAARLAQLVQLRLRLLRHSTVCAHALRCTWHRGTHCNLHCIALRHCSEHSISLPQYTARIQHNAMPLLSYAARYSLVSSTHASPTLSPTDPVPRGQLWPTGSAGDCVGEGRHSAYLSNAMPHDLGAHGNLLQHYINLVPDSYRTTQCRHHSACLPARARATRHTEGGTRGARGAGQGETDETLWTRQGWRMQGGAEAGARRAGAAARLPTAPAPSPRVRSHFQIASLNIPGRPHTHTHTHTEVSRPNHTQMGRANRKRTPPARRAAMSTEAEQWP